MAQIMSNKDMKLLLMLKKGIRAVSSSYLTLFEPFKMEKKIKILAQENNLVRLFGEMTNASDLSEKKPPLI